MKWPWHKKKPKKLTRAGDQDIEKAKKLIDAVVYPQIKKQIDILNNHLESEGIRVGVDITWIFDKVE